ncbi:MAG: ATP-binding cassette domain-containing protein [Spirochaetes bacterium]|nr:ATP-binding cassette domain-containing protein [Spirochaetota bacterium]
MTIKAQSVSKRYRSPVSKASVIDAVAGISLDINVGSSTVIYGPTGSGKTTLLRMLSGISKPTSGEIIFHTLHYTETGDRKLSSFRERYIGYVPQRSMLIKDLSVFENVISPNAFRQRHIRSLKSAARTLLERLNLEDTAQRKPDTLSGGESRMVMIARAILTRPAFLFADEPVSELDDDSAKLVLDLFSELKRDGSAIFIASHEPLAFGGNTDLYAIKNGRITEHTRGGHR